MLGQRRWLKSFFHCLWVKKAFLMVIWFYLILVERTIKYCVIGEEYLKDLKKAGQPVILAFWHGSIILPLCYLGHREIHVLISAHRSTSKTIHRLVESFGWKLIKTGRGQGESKAVIAMMRKVREGTDVILTPDGTSGPAGKLKPGLLYLARKTGAPIIPFGAAAYPRKQLNTWDSFILPHLFSRGVIIFGQPLWLPEDLGKGEIAEKTKELETILNQLQRQAEQTAAARS